MEPQETKPDATTEPKDLLVDETPISPTRQPPGRKNSLEAHLKHRPERSELVQRNILHASSAAPAIQARQLELERSQLADKLNEKISHRPTPDKLMESGVLHEDPRTAEEKYAEAIQLEYEKREGGA